jgi:glycosyltransferase involved in cell wall biosynthesis/2-polyprenyl-3-methyl-5-hydroxy-6-metoxy-1,4-benzoquinol methylase
MPLACTICACNYLPYARVLAESFYTHHPDGTFVVLLIDDEDEGRTPDDERIVWRRMRDIGLDEAEIRRLAAIYDVRELSTAVKPLLLRHLLDGGADAAIYLDPDIRIYHSLGPVWDLAARHGIVLTPHTTQPFPQDDSPVNNFYILAAGVYNLGFAGVGRRARPFLDWWWQGTRREALNDATKMMFTDQRWIDLVPSLFEPYLLKDPGYNVAYWNLHGRSVTENGQGFAVDGEPLRFFHFSGFDASRPWLLSRFQGDRPRVLLSDRPVLNKLCAEYAAALQQAASGAEAWSDYGWGRLSSGLEFTDGMRRLYRTALIGWEQGRGPEPPSPFDEKQPHAFIDWLNLPDEGGPRGISRYLYQLYESRIDLQRHFRDLHGVDGPRYLEWIHQDGVVQAYIPSELLPPHPHVRREPDLPRRDEEGLNVAGYFRAELGIGEAARRLVGAIEAAGIPYSTLTTQTGALSRQAHTFGGRREGTAGYDINLLCVNADMTPRFVRDMGPAFREGRYTVGYWFWEVDQLPNQLHAAFADVDEVWTATDFVADAVRMAEQRPVFTIPVPLVGPSHASPLTRQDLGLPNRFLFLFSFDFLSIFERKNPLALVRAFARAFEGDSGPMLLLKTINGQVRLNELECLRAEIGDRPDIRLVDGYYTAAEKDALVGLSDCYVSLHRSEGLGLTMAEAMAAGKPVIATGYSGNMQFMTEANSFLVDYVLTQVPRGCEPYPVDAHWADPDVDHAARLMRSVYADPGAAAGKGQQARADLLRHHSIEVSANAIARRLEAIRHSRRSHVVVAAGPPAELPSAREPLPQPAMHEPLSDPEPGARTEVATTLEETLARLDPIASPRVAVTPGRFRRMRIAAQRGLYRVLRPYWTQQNESRTELINVLTELAREVRQEREARQAAEERLAELRRDAVSSSELATASEAMRAELTRQLAALTALESEIGALRTESTRGRDDFSRRIDSLSRTKSDIGARVVALTRAVAETSASQKSIASAGDALDQRIRALEPRIEALEPRVGAFEPEVTSLRTRSESWFASVASHLDRLTPVVSRTEESLGTLENRLYAIPYMAEPGRFLDRDEQGRERLGYRAIKGTGSHGEYIAFEDLFRGPQAMIRERQAVYVPMLRSASEVVDIGCGRGEMLDLLKAAGTAARGVDSDPDMVAMCRAKGHRVDAMDAVDFLRAQEERSLHAIFSAQLVEHLPFDTFKAFLALCQSRLRPGGTAIIETVNPHALEAFKTFHTDLTHQRPIFPEVALSLVQLAGFPRAYVMFPLGAGALTDDRRTQGEYAVVATAGEDK